MSRGVPDHDRICAGVIGAAHGIKGAVRIRSFTEDPKAIAGYPLIRGDQKGDAIRIKLLRPSKGGFIATIEGVHDRSLAETLKGLKLYVLRQDLPEPVADEFYHHDLVGLAVKDGQGKKRGTVKAVENFGAGELLELALDEPVKDFGRTVMIPFTKALVPEVDFAQNLVTVLIEDWISNQVETGEKRG